MKKQEVEAVKIEKIVIKIGDKEQELTVESAKELQKILNDLFGGEKTTYVWPQPYVYVPSIWPYYPEPTKTVPYQPYITWCTYIDGTTLTVSNTSSLNVVT